MSTQTPTGKSPFSERTRTSDGPQVLAQETLDLHGDTSRLVTFLNQSLKDEGIVFGISRGTDDRLLLTVYRT